MTNVETVQRADWDALERDVVERIRLLRAACGALRPGRATDEAVVRDLIEPNVRLLASFCVSVAPSGAGG